MGSALKRLKKMKGKYLISTYKWFIAPAGFFNHIPDVRKTIKI